jgi:hypothetical protein
LRDEGLPEYIFKEKSPSSRKAPYRARLLEKSFENKHLRFIASPFVWLVKLLISFFIKPFLQAIESCIRFYILSLLLPNFDSEIDVILMILLDILLALCAEDGSGSGGLFI